MAIPVTTRDVTINNLTHSTTVTTIATALKELRTTSVTKSKVDVTSTSTGVIGKTTGKTCGPAKNTNLKNRKIQFLNFCYLLKMALDSEAEGATELVKPSSTVESVQDSHN